MRVIAHRRLTLPPVRSLPLSQARLAVPTLGVWLLLYLAAFHCGLNALAEVGARGEEARERAIEGVALERALGRERSHPASSRALPRSPTCPRRCCASRTGSSASSGECRRRRALTVVERGREIVRARTQWQQRANARRALPSLPRSHTRRARSPRRWNATSLRSFWRRWNVPVHEWCLRHLFLELQHYGGLPRGAAVGLTFLASGVLHELVFGLAFRCVRPWFLLGMLAQASRRSRARESEAATRTRLARSLARSLART